LGTARQLCSRSTAQLLTAESLLHLLYEQVEAQRMELEERDARIAEDAQIVKLARSAARQLAQKDAIIKAKNAEIARLNAKMVQFEQLTALMNAVTQPSGATHQGRELALRLQMHQSLARRQRKTQQQQQQLPHYQQQSHQKGSARQLPTPRGARVCSSSFISCRLLVAWTAQSCTMRLTKIRIDAIYKSMHNRFTT
jgi:hypothetical protein